jgi:HEAT repeat protein
VEELTELLAHLSSGDDAKAEQACLRLAEMGSTATRPLKELAASPNSETRWWALRTLTELPAADSVPVLLQALTDPDPAVRQCAALGLQLHPTPHAIPELIQAMTDDDSLVVRLAANALAAVGGEAVPPLLELMQNGPSKASLEATRALALIGDTRAIPAMFQALDGDSTLLEYWANEGLERMGVGMVFFKP